MTEPGSGINDDVMPDQGKEVEYTTIPATFSIIQKGLHCAIDTRDFRTGIGNGSIIAIDYYAAHASLSVLLHNGVSNADS